MNDCRTAACASFVLDKTAWLITDVTGCSLFLFCLAESDFFDFCTTSIQAAAGIGGMVGIGVFSRTDVHVGFVALLHGSL